MKSRLKLWLLKENANGKTCNSKTENSNDVGMDKLHFGQREDRLVAGKEQRNVLHVGLLSASTRQN